MSEALSSPAADHGLRLVGLQHRGLAFDFQWAWPVGARMQWLDDVLRKIVPAGPERRDGLVAYSLLRSGPDDQPVWWLTNHGSKMTCAINGSIVSCSSQQRLNHGDQIEIGITRLRVIMGDCPGDEDAWVNNRRGATHAEPEADGFDWAALDVYPSPFGRADFNDLLSLSPTEFAQMDMPPGSQALADVDPLDALHAQYLAKLKDPFRAEERPLWQVLGNGHRASLADPVEQWQHAAGGQHGMDDLLRQSGRIDAVIANLDALCFSDVLSPAPFDNVMQLFAPEGLRAQGPGTLAHDLPSLTRREHHSLSPDSAVTLFIPKATPENPDSYST